MVYKMNSSNFSKRSSFEKIDKTLRIWIVKSLKLKFLDNSGANFIYCLKYIIV